MSIEMQSKNLIFLISQPRAGSTLLQRILAGHPEIHTTAEPWLMLHPVYALREGGHEAEYAARTALRGVQDFLGMLEAGEYVYVEALHQMAMHLYGTACREAGKAFFLDKTPRYYFVIPDLARIFPEAKFVILLRNPLSVLASILNTWVKGDWTRLSRYYHDLIDAPRLLLEGMDLLEDRVAVIHYETLVTEPRQVLSSLCAQIGLEFHESMLEYGETPKPPGRHGDPTGVSRYGRPVTASVDRWLELGRSKQTRHLAEKYLSTLGSELLYELGYEHSSLETRLRAVPSSSLGPIVSWERALALDKTFRQKLHLLIVELFQKHRFVHSGKQLARLLTGRL
jgi:hypothetical protein